MAVYYPFAPENDATYRLVNGPHVAVFNDKLDPDYVGTLSEITGLDSAEVRESFEDLVQADGGVHGDFYYGRRPIVLTGKSYGHPTVALRNYRLDKLLRASNAMRSDATLSWRPSLRTENLIVNPSAEVAVTPWVANSAVPLSRSTTWAANGTASFRVNGTTAAGSTFPGISLGSADFIPVQAGRAYGIRATFNTITAPAVSSGAVAVIRFYDANKVMIGTSTDISGSTSGTATGVRSVVGVGTAPAGAAYAAIIVYVHANAAYPVDFYVDSVIVSPLPTATIASMPAYFDGTTAGMYWQGTPHASASGDFIEMFTTVRRQQPPRYTGGWVKDFQIALVSEYAPLYSAAVTARTALAGSTTGATQHVITNRGSGKAFPIIRIYGNGGQNPYVENMTTGEKVRYGGYGGVNLNLANGAWVEIDTLNHTATLNDGSSVNGSIDYSWSTPVWPSIIMGDNTFRLVNAGTMDVTYRDTWS
jgi:hypothetical protein